MKNGIDTPKTIFRSAATRAGARHANVFSALRARWRALYETRPRNRLYLEIALVLTVKVLILYALWAAFFSQPLARHMLVPQDQVRDHIISNTEVPPAGGSLAHPSVDEVKHDSD